MKKLLTATLLMAVHCLAAEKPKVIDWNPANPNCMVIYTDGQARERIFDNGRMIDAYAPILRDKHTYEVMVGIINQTNAIIDMDPAKVEAFSDDAPQLALPSIDADPKLAKEEKSQRRWAAFGAAMSAASVANTQGTVTDSNGNVSQVTISNPAAVRQAQENGATNQAAIAGAHAAESGHVLRRNTVALGAHVGGFVYLAKPKGMNKKSRVGSLAVNLGDTVYTFHYKNGSVPKL